VGERLPRRAVAERGADSYWLWRGHPGASNRAQVAGGAGALPRWTGGEVGGGGFGRPGAGRAGRTARRPGRPKAGLVLFGRGAGAAAAAGAARERSAAGPLGAASAGSLLACRGTARTNARGRGPSWGVGEKMVSRWRGRFTRQAPGRADGRGPPRARAPVGPPRIRSRKSSIATPGGAGRRGRHHWFTVPRLARAQRPVRVHDRAGSGGTFGPQAPTSLTTSSCPPTRLFIEKVVDESWGLYHKHPPEKAVVLCVDEKSGMAGPGPVPARCSR